MLIGMRGIAFVFSHHKKLETRGSVKEMLKIFSQINKQKGGDPTTRKRREERP